MGRPKGKTKHAISLSLTQAQIDFLRHQKNASELVGKVLNDLMAVDGVDLTEDYVRVVSLKQQLDALQEKESDIRSERDKLIRDNESHFQTEVGDRDPYGRWENRYITNPEDPIPTDDEGKITKRVWVALGEKLKAVESEIARVKAQLLQSG